MPTLLERLMRRNTLSFGVMALDGGTWFIDANRCELRGDTIVFLIGWKAVVAVAPGGTWQRVMRGISLEDFEGGK